MLHATDHKQREREGEEQSGDPSHKEQLISLPKWRTHFKATRHAKEMKFVLQKELGFCFAFSTLKRAAIYKASISIFFYIYAISQEFPHSLWALAYIHISLFYAIRKMLKLISGHKYGLQIGLIECNSSCSVWWSSIRPVVPMPCGQWVIFISFSLPPSSLPLTCLSLPNDL